jgi:hypothetical protein
MVEYLSIRMGQRFSRYTHYVFGYVGKPPKTSSACIFAVDDFPRLSKLGENHTANTAAIDTNTIGFVSTDRQQNLSSVGIVTLDGFSGYHTR